MRSLRLLLPCLTLFHTTELFYSSIFQDLLARSSLSDSSISSTFVAQYCVSSFLETIRNTLTKPYFLILTTIPSGGISIVSRVIFFVLSGLTKRFDFNRVKKCHCFFLIALRFSTLAYHMSTAV